MQRAITLLALVAALLLALLPAVPVAAQNADGLGVQRFLDAQPGLLKTYREDERSAATLIESASLYYGLSPRLHLALLEATASLLSDPAPPAELLRQPFGPAGPDGFAAQIDWASRELRAGLGPYSRPPTLRFSDGLTLTLTLDQAPEGVAVQRFLAPGRTLAEWRAAVDRFGAAFEHYFANQLVEVGTGADNPANSPATPEPGEGFLLQPWPAGTPMVHLAYFDHVYPTVDTGDDGNGYVVNYRGQGNVQYDGHDGHDYYFPEQPIGTPILAAAAGVAYARTHRGYGVVIIHPGGYETVYWHLDGFAATFAGLIDTGQGVPVRAGDLLGTSGRTGFVAGTPHLHFEVRRFGKQIDPYGWSGSGADPCAAYAACLPGAWLWASSIAGSYDFSTPGAQLADAAPASVGDKTPPIGTLSVEPSPDLLFAADFDNHPLQRVGRGFPTLYGAPRYSEGRQNGALLLNNAATTYPVAGNLRPTAGTISLWAELPASYPESRIPRHYLLAASASPDDAPVYSGTLALRRDAASPEGEARWTFWTTAANETSRDLLSAPDTLAPGWHHFAISWDAAAGRKALYLDGVLVAQTSAATLPAELGSVLQLGRWTYGGGAIGAALDDLAIYRRVLSADEIAALATQPAGTPSTPLRLRERQLRIDTNAIDDQGGIVAVQLGLNGEFEAPQPYYDSYRWRLSVAEGEHALAVRYVDRAGNSATLTQTVVLDLPPQGEATIERETVRGVVLQLTGRSANGPLEVQLSQDPTFAGAVWRLAEGQVFWLWQPRYPRLLYARWRDATGDLSEPFALQGNGGELHLPLLQR